MADVDARRRAKRIAQERGLGRLANDTKWREFFGRVIELRIAIEVKILYEDEPFINACVWSPSENYLEGSRMGPELYVFIEWIRSHEVEKLQAIAVDVGLECELKNGKATVYGYR